MRERYRWIIAALGFILAIFMAWYFSNIVVYIIVAGVLSLIGSPLVEFICKFKIGKFSIPRWTSALFTLLLILAVVAGLVVLFVPLISNQANTITNIDVNKVTEYYSDEISSLKQFLVNMQVMKSEERIVDIIDSQITSWINIANFSNVVSGIASTTGSLFIGVFSVMFLAFFFLRDPHLLKSGILLLSPTKWEEHVRTILHKTKVMLSRYFLGLMTELISMITLISLGLTVFGVKNALLIGFLGGLMNIIPYLGPLIGGSIGVILGVTSVLSVGQYDAVLLTAITIVLTFAVANLIDNIVLQPLIYSKSVNAHPIEIFLVIIMAGSLAGIPGMILAIPAYTVIRIVAKEFLSGFKVVDELTKNI
jgi:predicted PurR-regulated permease PerM